MLCFCTVLRGACVDWSHPEVAETGVEKGMRDSADNSTCNTVVDGCVAISWSGQVLAQHLRNSVLVPLLEELVVAHASHVNLTRHRRGQTLIV